MPAERESIHQTIVSAARGLHRSPCWQSRGSWGSSRVSQGRGISRQGSTWYTHRIHPESQRRVDETDVCMRAREGSQRIMADGKGGGGGGERYMCRDVMIILLTTSLHVYIPHSWHYRTCPQASPDGITSPLYRTHIIRIRRGCGLNSTGLNGSCTGERLDMAYTSLSSWTHAQPLLCSTGSWGRSEGNNNTLDPLSLFPSLLPNFLYCRIQTHSCCAHIFRTNVVEN